MCCHFQRCGSNALLGSMSCSKPVTLPLQKPTRWSAASSRLSSSRVIAFLRSAQLFEKSFAFQLVEEAFVKELLDIDVALRLPIAVADELESVANAVAVDARREREPRREIIVRRLDDFRVGLLEPFGIHRHTLRLVGLEDVDRLAVSAHEAFHRVAVFFQERAARRHDGLGKTRLQIAEISE